MSDEMQKGTVKFYNDQKGYGFIAPENGSADVFVHATALQRGSLTGLNDGQEVMFNTAINERTGKSAVDSISLV